MSFTKTTEPIEVPFGIWTRVKESRTRWGPGFPTRRAVWWYGLGWKNHLLGGGPDYPTEVVVWRYGLRWKNHLLAGGPDSPLEVAFWRYRLWWKNHLLAGGLDSPLEVEVWRGTKFCRYIYGSKRSVGLHRRLTQWRPLGGVTVKCPDSFVSLLLLRFAEFCRVTELLIERHLLPTYRTIKSACVAL